jgi:DNA recombination protein RmuC
MAIFVGAAFAAGLAVGLVILRLGRAKAMLEARAAAAGEMMAISADLARAQSVAERVPLLEAAGEERARAMDRLRNELEAAKVSLAEERTRLATDLDAEKRAAAERAAESERSKEQVRAEIEILAARLLDEKGKAMLHQSREGLEALLKPVAEKLKEFEAKVEKTYDQENRDRASLLSSLQRLQETQAKLHEDAESLARALTGESKAQGDWGELVLERVLETAGLTEGREYDLQVNHVDEEGGRKRPDALVYLPGNRVIVVDAKCSLTAFVEAMRATTPTEREAALDAHVASVRAHVRGLAAKSYQEVVKEKTVDIVLLFVPNEAAFHEAIAREVGLYEEAFRQRVVICSPTTLLAALQLISHVWRSENQNANAQKIAEEAGKLLDKLKAFVGDLDEVGNRIDQAQTSFQAAKNKLVSGRGNVMKKASDVLKLGARVKPETAERLMLYAAGAEDDEVDLLLPEPAVTQKAAGPSRSPVS